MALLARPSRAAWGTALTVGVGALLPAAFAPFGAHSVPALSAGTRPRPPTQEAQDALWGPPRPASRSRLRFELGQAAFGAPDGPSAGTSAGSLAGALAGAAAETADGPGPEVGPGWSGASTISLPVLVPSADGTTQPPAVPGWFSPAPGAAISQPFGVPDPEYAAGYHTGVDFAVFSGTPLYAVADATVVVAGWGGAYGNWIVLRLPDGHYALYAHMSRLDVHTGDHVAGGQQIGLSGESGNARGPHLHFEIRTRNEYGAVIDPLPYLRAHGCHV